MVLVENGSILIRTEGTGTGAYPITNKKLAQFVWETTDAEIQERQGEKAATEDLCLQ